MNAFGFDVIESIHHSEFRARLPRSKKRRIRKKWRGRGRWVPRHDYIIDHERKLIVCHPLMAAKLKQVLVAEQRVNPPSRLFDTFGPIGPIWS